MCVYDIKIYINDNLPHRLLKQFSGIYHGIDYLTFEIIVKSRKWYVSYLYRPPNVNESILCDLLNVLSDEFISNNNLYVAYGDLNCNWFKYNALSDLCEIYGMVNLIEQPTCFKGDKPTLVDVFLTNRPKCFSGVCNTDLGTCDFHNCICVSSKMFAPSHSKHKITYRSMKHFSESAFQNDVDSIPFHVCDIFEDIDDVYWMHDKLFMSVLDKHAPVKTKTVNTQVPYMNSTLRKAINQRNMWRSKHFRNRNDKQLRMKYVMWRNHVVKLHKNSIRNYFAHRCNDNVGSKNFYKTIKPFLSTKQSLYSGSKIILKENDSIISDVSKVADIFNMYYESIAEYKFQSDGLDNLDFDEAIAKHASHTSISLIKQSISRNYEFSFSPISVQSMSKYISLLKSNKAVGHDGLHAAYLKCSGDNMSTSLCNVFNACISSCDFPSTLKWADINPIYKKKDNLCKENYRSVNVLTIVSKVFERVLSDQLMTYFVSILNHSLSAYRAGYSRQHVILQLTEFWRQSLDKRNCVGTVAMDLSKAFDSMPHGLLIAKLSAYGVSKHACNLITNFLCNRRQRTKVMGKCSEWVTINRGVPQGSVLGPLLFNIFVNDLFYTDIDSIICNYADDNHLVNESNSVDTLKVSLERDAHRAIAWFDNNYMDANPDKFQCISLDRFGRPPISISVDGNTIPSSDSIKVLGVTLDNSLQYDIHISILCSKASIQINAMKRIGKYLNTDCRIAMYKSFISSNFSYCPVSWMFCGKRNSDKLEKLQERALRFVFSDYTRPYSDLLKHGNFLSLSALRIRYLAIEMFKCVHGLTHRISTNFL